MPLLGWGQPNSVRPPPGRCVHNHRRLPLSSGSRTRWWETERRFSSPHRRGAYLYEPSPVSGLARPSGVSETTGVGRKWVVCAPGGALTGAPGTTAAGPLSKAAAGLAAHSDVCHLPRPQRSAPPSSWAEPPRVVRPGHDPAAGGNCPRGGAGQSHRGRNDAGQDLCSIGASGLGDPDPRRRGTSSRCRHRAGVGETPVGVPDPAPGEGRAAPRPQWPQVLIRDLIVRSELTWANGTVICRRKMAAHPLPPPRPTPTIPANALCGHGPDVGGRDRSSVRSACPC